MNDFAKEIDQMNRTFDVNVGVSEFLTEAPSTEAPVEEDLSTEAPSTIAPEDFFTDAPGTDEPSTEAPSTEAPREDELTRRIAELETKLAERKEPTTKAPSTEAPIELSEQNFLEGIDIEDVAQDPKEFNKLLNKIYSQAVKDAEKTISSKFDKSFPDKVNETVASITAAQKASEQFYTDNKDLEPFKKVVATVFGELAPKSTNKPYEEIMKDVAVESRKRLGLDKKPKRKEEVNTDKKPPRLPGKKGRSSRGTEQKPKDPLQVELEEMNKTIGR